MEPSLTGWLIGKSGAHIQELQDLSGCHISVNSEMAQFTGMAQIVLEGPQQTRENVKQLIQERMEQKLAKDNAKGGGKGGGGGIAMGIPEVLDPLTSAAQIALQPIVHMEQQWPPHELLKRVCKYFQNALKTIDFKSPWQESVDLYCDYLFASVFQALYERPWVSEVNWTPVVQAAVKELFPPEALANIPEEVLDVGVVSSAERAFEECRLTTLVWEALRIVADGKATQTKISKALEAGRKEAWENARTTGEEYLQTWIAGTIRHLGGACQGQPVYTLPQQGAAQLFCCLVAGGGLPKTGDIAMEPERDDWPAIIFPAIKQAYAEFEPLGIMEGSGKGMKGKGKGFNPYGGKGGGAKGMMKGMMMQMQSMMGNAGW